mmetsp:Transcript_13164/g.32967  ORF Transcript_13164/g.32967 Transcript_13164/m.32967 type:complete len:251 (+) Transcript_13164:284-1036(+)
MRGPQVRERLRHTRVDPLASLSIGGHRQRLRRLQKPEAEQRLPAAEQRRAQARVRLKTAGPNRIKVRLHQGDVVIVVEVFCKIHIATSLAAATPEPVLVVVAQGVSLAGGGGAQVQRRHEAGLWGEFKAWGRRRAAAGALTAGPRVVVAQAGSLPGGGGAQVQRRHEARIWGRLKAWGRRRSAAAKLPAGLDPRLRPLPWSKHVLRDMRGLGIALDSAVSCILLVFLRLRHGEHLASPGARRVDLQPRAH